MHIIGLVYVVILVYVSCMHGSRPLIVTLLLTTASYEPLQRIRDHLWSFPILFGQFFVPTILPLVHWDESNRAREPD